MGKRSPQVLIRERETQLIELYLNGKTRAAMIQFASDEGWGLSERQIDTYIRKATARIEELGNQTIEEKKKLIENALWETRIYAMKMGEVGVARQCLTDLARINGLEKHVFLVEKKRELSSFTDEDIDDAIEVGPQEDS